MKNKGFILFLFIVCFAFVQCAKRGTPTGGEIDIDPPRFVRANPENYSTNFRAEEIRIHFNEYIKLVKPQEQIIISPPITPRPEITPLGNPQRYVRIRIDDTLQENTTYVINFGNSVVDNNESNPLPFFKYVFSTGSYIDSLTVSGTVNDALLSEAEPFISVMLYERDENFTDSLIYTQPPRYITNTLDSLRTFELTNLKAGTYQLVAVKDRNNDYKYNPGREKIAFINEPVTIPTDTTYNLTLFQENLAFQPERPKQLNSNKLLIGYRGRIVPDSVNFQPVSAVPANFEYRLVKVPAKDSIHFYFKPQIETDTLKLRSLTSQRTDTLTTRMVNMPADTLQVSTEPSGNLEFGANIVLRANTPLSTVNNDLISIMDRDSTMINFTSELRPFENVVHLQFQKTENQSYTLNLLPGALTDFYNSTNDSISRVFKTKAYSEYGNLSLNLLMVRSFPIIVQLTDDKGVVKAEQYSTSSTNFRFEYITPGKYLLRLIYDENENGIWDTGNYLKRLPPEEIIYYPGILDVRQNWDINETFNLN